jgi:hypothetical protein
VDGDLIHLRQAGICFGLNSIESRILAFAGSITYYKKDAFYIDIVLPKTYFGSLHPNDSVRF